MVQKKKDSEETIIQNKIAIAVFNITLFVALAALLETIDSVGLEFKIIVCSIMALPALLYFLFLIFLPLRYKQKHPYTFRFLEIFEISESMVNNIYDLASESFFFVVYSTLLISIVWGSSKLTENYNIQIPQWVVILIGSVTPLFLMKILQKVLNLKYADYVEDEKYKKFLLRKKKKNKKLRE